MNWLEQARWSPYVVGAGIGLLSWLTFLLSDKPLACSTSLVRTVGMIEKALRGEKVKARLYYKEFPPIVEWGVMLVIGLFLGALVSALLSGSFAITWVPPRWSAHFGSSALVRWVAALLGGILLAFGARWANGCTSGHGISGTLQLTLSSWIAAICFFVGGIIIAFVLYGNSA
jgi:uncharacterized membrane protein YedE/YeeE